MTPDKRQECGEQV